MTLAATQMKSFRPVQGSMRPLSQQNIRVFHMSLVKLKDCHINLPQHIYRMQTNEYEGSL